MDKLPKACVAVLNEPVSRDEMAAMCPTVNEEFGAKMVKMAEALGLSPMDTIEVAGWASRTGAETGLSVSRVAQLAMGNLKPCHPMEE